jgi:ABC-type glycerol-3-phosphate transport system substrate-binding protein
MRTFEPSARIMSRRQVLKLIGLGSAGAALAACAAPAAPAQPAPAGQEPAPAAQPAVEGMTGDLRVMVCCATPSEEPLRNKFNADFEANYPGVKIVPEILPAGQGYFEKLQTMMAANTLPDVFDMWEGYVQPYAANGALMPLDDFIDGDDKIKREDILPVIIPAQSWQGKSYAFVYGFMPGPVSLYYNVDHFEQAGLQPPTPDWTWNDVREAALKLHTVKDGNVERYGLSFDNWFVVWQYWIWSNGGDIFNADETKTTITEPQAVDAVQFWYDMVNKDKIAVDETAYQLLGGSMAKVFASGMISLRLGNYWDLGELKETQGANWKAVLSPKSNAGQRVWYMHLGCWSIGSNSKMAKAAWTYARDFVLQRPIDSVTPYIPPLQSLMSTFTGPDHAQLGYGALPEIVSQPGVLRIPGAGEKFDKIQGLIQAELDLAFTGKKSVAEAMAAAAPKVDEELARRA